MNAYNLQAEVHKKLDSGAYRVKMSILNSDIAMYINGNLVSPPNGDYPNWSVRTPKVGDAEIVKFNGKSPLWKEYKQACIEAVQEYIRLEKLDSPDVMEGYENKTDEEFNKQLLEDIEKIGF